MKQPLISYLAAPYSHPDPEIRRQRVDLVTHTAYFLFKQSFLVYSPLTHNVPIDNLGILGDWKVWRDFDHGMLARCDKLLLLKLEGWQISKGMQAEIAFAQQNNIPIEEMELPEEVWQAYQEHQTRNVSVPPALHLLTQRFNQFIEDRNWQQYGSPKNYVMSLASEVGELAAHFRWMNEEQSYRLSPDIFAQVKDEIGDVLINLVCISNALKIDLLEAGLGKLDKINKKYPLEREKVTKD